MPHVELRGRAGLARGRRRRYCSPRRRACHRLSRKTVHGACLKPDPDRRQNVFRYAHDLTAELRLAARVSAGRTRNQETESSPTSIRIYGGVGRSCLAVAPWPRRATTSCSTTARAGAFGRRTSPARLRATLGAALGPTPVPGHRRRIKARRSGRRADAAPPRPSPRSGPERVPVVLLGGMRRERRITILRMCTTNFPIYQRRSCARRCKQPIGCGADRSILEGSCGRTKPSGGASRARSTRLRPAGFPIGEEALEAPRKTHGVGRRSRRPAAEERDGTKRPSRTTGPRAASRRTPSTANLTEAVRPPQAPAAAPCHWSCRASLRGSKGR